jgi:hypothetical protein
MVAVDRIHSLIGIEHVLDVEADHNVFAHEVCGDVALTNGVEEKFTEPGLWGDV